MANKKLVGLILGIVVIAAAGIIYGILRLSEKDESIVTIRLSGNESGSGNLPVLIAWQKKIFQKHGLNPELVPFPSSKDALQALALGKIDISSVGLMDFFAPLAKDAPVKILAPSNENSVFLMVRPNSIKSVKELAGHSVAARWNSVQGYSLVQALRAEGVDPKTVKFIDMNRELRPLALLNKKTVDADPESDLKVATYQNMGAVILDGWIAKGYDQKLIPNEVFAINTDFLKNNKDAAEKFVDALIEAIQLMRNDINGAATALDEYIKQKEGENTLLYTADSFRGSLNKTNKYYIWYNPQKYLEMFRHMQENTKYDRELTLEDLSFTDFNEKLKSAQAALDETKN